VRFRPGGAHALLGLPLEELTDGAVATAALWGRAGRRLDEEVAHAPHPDAARAILERFLLRRLIGSPPDRRLDAALDLLLRRRGRASVAELARAANWSPRHLEREFRRKVGLAPKMLSRIARFQNLLRLSGRFPGRTWAELSLAAGYADQAHMTREFRELSGGTPSQRHLAGGELTRHFVDPGRLDALLRSRPGDVAFVQDAGEEYA
jgi:AraC-like DNA-binding protein